MTADQIVSKLVKERENTLSVRTIEVVVDPNSLSNPKIQVGTLPFYQWSKEQEIEFCVVYGRYLDCSVLISKHTRKDKSFKYVKGKQAAEKLVRKIIKDLLANRPILTQRLQ